MSEKTDKNINIDRNGSNKVSENSPTNKNSKDIRDAYNNDDNSGDGSAPDKTHNLYKHVVYTSMVRGDSK